jgi:uncharacterized cupredoxin-like copper-binding protein
MRLNLLYGAVTMPVLVVFSIVPSLAATSVVKVELQDPSTSGDLKNMQMKLDHDTVPAGRVRFDATNESKGLVHEMIVVKTDQDPSTFPYDAKKDEVIEAKVKSLGEVSELKAGKSGKLTLKLKPGSYVLYCNQGGHMHQGMWAHFTVTP